MPDWVDGRPAAELSVHDRGPAYGDGLFETPAARAGTSRLLKRHLARPEEGCRRLAIPLDTAALRQELLTFCAALGDGVTKLVVTRGEGLRGYAPPIEASPRRVLSGLPRPAYPERHWQQGVHLFAHRTRLAEQPLLAGLKHLNRLKQAFARTEWSGAGHAEGLMLDVYERVVEGVFSNLLLVLDGTLVAPDLRRCDVAGVMRAELPERTEGIGVPLAIRDVPMAELATVDEASLCNGQSGTWPVWTLDEHVWPVGELTRRLQDQLRDDLDF